MRVAAIYAALGASANARRSRATGALAYGARAVCQSLDVWQDMQKRGILTAEDAEKPQEVPDEIARCDASLRRLDRLRRSATRRTLPAIVRTGISPNG